MKKLLLCILFLSPSIFACSNSYTLHDQKLIFFGHHLRRRYTIRFSRTLSAIEAGVHSHDRYPYYKKAWSGSCEEAGFKKCTEYTVYPNGKNFNPNLMTAIKKYTHGARNRGMVRIMVNTAQTKYSYTTDHEQDYCGPYSLP